MPDHYVDEAYNKFFDRLGSNRSNTEQLFSNLLGGITRRRGQTVDNFAGARNALSASQSDATSQTNRAYQNALNRMQASPEAYVQPQSAATQLAVPNVGADQATMNALATAAGNQQNAANAAQTNMYDMLRQSDQASRASRMADVDLARAGSLSQLAAIGNAQQFGLTDAELSALAAIDGQYSETELARINALAGLDESELSGTLASIADRLAADRNVVTDAQSDRTSDQQSIASAVNIFAQMVNPIVDQIDPESVVELWVAFAAELGIPVADAVAAVEGI
jgi:hypothetical protein